jgi:hypothetical protein
VVETAPAVEEAPVVEAAPAVEEATAAETPAPAPAAADDDLDEFGFEVTENGGDRGSGNLFDMFIKKK